VKGQDEPATGWRPLRTPAPADRRLEASPFSRLAVTHALSVAGDALVTMALAGSLFFSISPNAARGRVLLSLVLTVTPFALVAPFLGPAIDRREGGRRAMVVLVAVARALTAVFMAQVIHGLLLFPAAFVYLVLSKTHSVAKSSLVPAVVDSDEELVQANSRLALIGVVMGFLAAIPGIPVLRLFGAEWVVGLAAVVFGAAAIAGLRIRAPRADSGLRSVPVFGRDRVAHEADAGAVRERGIRAAAIAMGGLRGGVGFLTFLIAFSLRRDGAPAWMFGVALAASMGGTLLGAAVAPALRKSLVEERLLAGCLAVVAVAGFVSSRLAERPGAVVMAAAVGFAASAGRLAFDSVVQRDAPGAVRGRQFARFEAAFQLAWVGGAIIPVALSFSERVGASLLCVGATLLCMSYVIETRRR
jgi:hypothetical protein